MTASKTIYCEMMSHTAIFTHHQPNKIAIVGDNASGIAEEVSKHPQVMALNSCEAPFDIIISATDNYTTPLANFYEQLNDNGILICQSASPFEIQKLKSHYLQLKSQQFYDIQIVSFPQPEKPTSWCTALMAIKNFPFKRVREKDIFNRTFTTQYYNFDVHKASLVLPEFMREEFAI